MVQNLLKNRPRITDVGDSLMVPRGQKVCVWGDQLGDWDQHIDTIIYKI